MNAMLIAPGSRGCKAAAISLPQIQPQLHSRGHDLARQRLNDTFGEPLLHTVWRNVLFLHFEVDPKELRRAVPAPFELELHQGRAIASVVAVTMDGFRANPVAPVWGQFFELLPAPRCYNIRTYVRHRCEPGACFFWSWISRPHGVPLPSRPLGLACAFPKTHHRMHPTPGRLDDAITTSTGGYECHAHPAAEGFAPCPAGSLSEFAMERYTGYFWHRGGGRIFRVWHEPWEQAAVTADITDFSLVEAAFPWFKGAPLVGAHYSPGCDEVWLGRPHRLEELHPHRNHHGPGAVFELP